MSLKNSTKVKLRTVFSVTLAGIIIGPLFATLAFGKITYERALKGLIVGFLITFLSQLFEKFVFESQFKRLRFSATLFIRTLVYIFVISFSAIMVWVIDESYILNSRSIFETIQTDDFKHFMTKGDFPYVLIFAISVGFIINFLLQLNHLLGKGVLLSYVSGRYHKPKIEERFFMFLDLESSTTIAEKIGPVRYHRFMNSYFLDINEPIIASRGEIYQYVGDEVVISWKKENGIKESNCIECFFRIHKQIENLREKYIKEFGLVPGFKAGVHYGEVVIGEVGDSKKEIVFLGDVMNTTSRIQGQSKAFNKRIIVSEKVTELVSLDGKYKTENMGKVKLKGKEHEVQLFSIVKAGS